MNEPKPKLVIDPEWTPETSQIVRCWHKYREQIYGTNALPPTQERECSCCFYAGMTTCLLLMLQISQASNEEVGSELIDALRKDIIQANLYSRRTPAKAPELSE